MENTLPQHAGDEPSKLSFGQLKDMTDNFAKEIGRGSFGVVYKGVNSNGKEIAVKVLKIAGIDDSEFQKEYKNLKMLKHPNIVELVGFCNESEKFTVEYEGKLVTAEEIHTVLCFEYVSSGSLGKHLYDEHTGLSWQKRYKIIKGICDGLKYLRDGLEFPVWHLDLKPGNILLDENMLPKIADFGSSKLLGKDQTRKSINSVGTQGYWPPEYVNHQIIAKEFDIFSLGVIMTKVMIGSERYKSIADMPPRNFVKQVHDNWKKRLQKVLRMGSLEVHCQQVKTCIQIAMECLRPNRQERPIIKDIVSRLNETEIMIGDLGAQEQEDFFPRINIKEEKLHHASHDLWKLSFKMLEDITNNFAEDCFLGSDLSGKYYRGVLKDGQVIVVKLLHDRDVLLEIELTNLMRLTHQNVVQIVGFCDEEGEIFFHGKGRLVLAIRRHRAICLEFVPNKSLREFLLDKHQAHCWDLRFNIIMGICNGLKYLHDANIMHLDLKTKCILLDEKMVPKIGNYGLSNFEESITSTTLLPTPDPETIQYLPPEYIYKQVISDKYDIYSLGILLMKIVIGEMIYWQNWGMDEPMLIEHVHHSWKSKLQEIPRYPSVEEDCKQVRACVEIAMLCTKLDQRERPTMEYILQKLNMVETKKNDPCSQIEQLCVTPLELRFPFDPKKAVHCSLQIHNKGDDRVAFMLVAKNSKSHLTKLPLCRVVPPRCTYTHNLTMRKQSKPSSESVEFVTLQSVAVADHDLLRVGHGSFTVVYEEFFRKAERAGYVVQEMTLKAVCNTPAERSASESTQSMIEIVATQNSQQLSSIDVHPEEPLIVTTNQGGILRVWNYKTTTLNSIGVTEQLVHAAKFVAREKWLVAGDVNGCIHVYSYGKIKRVTSFDAHDSSIASLAVHPEHPFVLSSSDDDPLIKLWDWKKEWKFTRDFNGHTKKVTQLKFDPENTDSFVSASLDGTVKIWSIHSDGGCIITMDGCVDGLLCVDYFKRRNRWHLITGTMYGTAQIWDMEMELMEGCDEKKGCVETLEGHAGRITAVNLYPELSLLITGSLDGTIRLWDSETYKLKNIIDFNLGALHAFGFIKGERMVVGCDQGIAVMEFSPRSRSPGDTRLATPSFLQRFRFLLGRR